MLSQNTSVVRDYLIDYDQTQSFVVYDGTNKVRLQMHRQLSRGC